MKFFCLKIKKKIGREFGTKSIEYNDFNNCKQINKRQLTTNFIFSNVIKHSRAAVFKKVGNRKPKAAQRAEKTKAQKARVRH